MPSLASPGFSRATPRMLRTAGSASNPKSRSGDERWKNDSAVRLDDLAKIDDPPQVLSGRRRLDGQDVVDGLGRRDQVTDGADPADPGHEGGHLVNGPALGDALEAPELGDVETASTTSPRSSSWIVILEWPSIRVTGSIVMVRLMSMPQSAPERDPANAWDASGEQSSSMV